MTLVPFISMLTAVPPVLANGQAITWFYVIPLAMSVSLVYNATRFEDPKRILIRALKHFGTILMFMVIVFVFLFLLSHRL